MALRACRSMTPGHAIGSCTAGCILRYVQGRWTKYVRLLRPLSTFGWHIYIRSVATMDLYQEKIFDEWLRTVSDAPSSWRRLGGEKVRILLSLRSCFSLGSEWQASLPRSCFAWYWFIMALVASYRDVSTSAYYVWDFSSLKEDFKVTCSNGDNRGRVDIRNKPMLIFLITNTCACSVVSRHCPGMTRLQVKQ